MVTVDGVPRPRAIAANLALYLTHFDEWAEALGHDEFLGQVVKTSAPSPAWPAPSAPCPITDQDLLLIQQWCAHQARGSMAVQYSPEVVRHGVEIAARLRPVHRVRDYLRSVRWDGTPRLDRWLATYLGADDGPAVRAIGTMWMISAVARVHQPGCQVDHMLILEGQQGIGKSQAVRVLAGDWLLPALPSLRDDVRAASALRGIWIAEASELDAIRGAPAERVKDFVTRTRDVYRAAYARTEISVPRQCVFVGTTNSHVYLDDPTGARRFWGVRVTRVDADALARDRDQLWAEAVHRYDSGTPWWPTGPLEEALRLRADERREVDVWTDRVLALATTQHALSTSEILTGLGVVIGSQRPADARRVAAILTAAGWQQERVRRGGARPRVWVHPTARDTIDSSAADDDDVQDVCVGADDG